MSDFKELVKAGGTLTSVLNGIAIVVTAVLLLNHSFRFYQDMFTIDRNSVQHRRYRPIQTSTYKWIAWSTFLSILFFFLGKINSFVWGFKEGCMVTFVLSISGYCVGKLFLYLIFLFRLKGIYGETAYAYNIKCLNFWSIFFFFYMILNITAAIAGMVVLSNKGDDGCSIDPLKEPFLLLMLGLFILQDFVFSSAFVIAFILPLRSVIKHVNAHSDATQDTQQHKKLIYAAVKTTTLTAVTVISTIIVTLLVGAITMDLTPVDLVFNTISLFLMTPYYADAVYYQKLCCCCIRCCTPKTDTYESKVRLVTAKEVKDGESTTMGMSADTMDQLRVAALDISLNESNKDAGNSGHSEQISAMETPSSLKKINENNITMEVVEDNEIDSAGEAVENNP